MSTEHTTNHDASRDTDDTDDSDHAGTPGPGGGNEDGEGVAQTAADLAAASPFADPPRTLNGPLGHTRRGRDGAFGGAAAELGRKLLSRHRAALDSFAQLRHQSRVRRDRQARAEAGDGRSRVAWAGQIARSVASSLVRNTPLTLAAVLCMAISLSLVGTSLLVASGVSSATERWRGGVETIVFLDPDTSDARAAQIRAALDANPDVASLEWVSQADAYAEFSEMFANSPELVASVDADALPASWRVTAADGTSADRVERLAAPLLREDGDWADGIYQVVYAKDAVDSVMSVSSFARNGLMGVAAVLALCALVLTYAACRAAAWARRDELAVMRLVGAPRWLVRAPFVVEGALSGLAGALGAAAAVWALSRWVSGRLEGGSGAGILQYFSVDGADVRRVLGLLVVLGAVLGTVGAATAVWRYVTDGDARTARARRVKAHMRRAQLVRLPVLRGRTAEES